MNMEMTYSARDWEKKAELLSKCWKMVQENDEKEIAALSDRIGVNVGKLDKMWESDDFVCVPVTVERRDGETVSRQKVVFLLGDEELITIQPTLNYDLFDKAITRIRRSREITIVPESVMILLLTSLNESCERVVSFMSDVLDNMSDDVRRAKSGRDEDGKALSDDYIEHIVASLAECEEALSNVQESQIRLLRAASHLAIEVSKYLAEEQVTSTDMPERVRLLMSDLKLVRQHAQFEQDKVQFLQDTCMAQLSQKQNGVVKVFTIITAVFLPPTLISTFYGMNFTMMPELTAVQGLPITVTLTLLAALLPLVWIKRAGWLR